MPPAEEIKWENAVLSSTKLYAITEPEGEAELEVRALTFSRCHCKCSMLVRFCYVFQAKLIFPADDVSLSPATPGSPNAVGAGLPANEMLEAKGCALPG